MLEYLLGLVAVLLLSWPTLIFIKKYPRSAHWAAFVKAFFLWLISTSPVFAGILLARPTDTLKPVGEQFQIEVLANFTISEMFVYTAAFLAPVLYVIFDIIKSYNEGELKIERNELSKYMRGMQGVLLSSIVLLILTLLAYSSYKSNPTSFSETYLALFLTGKGMVLYIVSLFIWYSVVLWETAPNLKYISSTDEQSVNFSDAYATRRDQNNGE